MKQKAISAHLADALQALDGIEAEYERLVRIQKAAGALVAAHDALYELQTMSEQDYDNLAGLWKNLRDALAGRKPAPRSYTATAKDGDKANDPNPS